MQKTYLFYDLETSGLNACFDQVMQFAAIRTTLDLKEIERYQLTIKLNPDVIPSPSALITHRIPINEWLTGLCEFEAMQKIHEWLNTPGTLSLGYNTLNFDDEFLRFSFFRNLLPPYQHQYANQCNRLDIFPITILYFLFQKEALNWPNKDGKFSFKLENLNEANNFCSGRAHHAMTDVEVTLSLARRLFQYPDMWHYAIAYFDKGQDKQRELKLPTTLNGRQEALAISPDLGIQHYFQSVVVNLGTHTHYKNQTVWLRLDRPELMNTTFQNIAQNTRILKKKTGESCFLLPLKERFTHFLSHETREIISLNRQFLQNNPKLFQAICDYHQNFQYPQIPQVDVDACLYQTPFWKIAEYTWSEKFHRVSVQQKMDLLKEAPNEVMKAQAIRILGRHYFDHLPKSYQVDFHTYLSDIRKNNDIKDYQGNNRITAKRALDEIIELSSSNRLDKEQKELLKNLEQYIITLHQQPSI